MKAPDSIRGSGRLAPLVQAGLAALVAGSLLSFSAIAFNDGFTSTTPEEGVVASPIETGSGGPVVVPGLPGANLAEPASDVVAELPDAEERGRDDAVLGTRFDEAGAIPQIQEPPSIADPSNAGRPGDGTSSGRDGGTEDGSGSPWLSRHDGQSGSSDAGDDGDTPHGGSEGGSGDGGSDDGDRDPERPEAKPRDEDDEPEARGDEDDDDDDASNGSYHAAGHSGASGKSEPSGDSLGGRRGEVRPEEDPTVDEPTAGSNGNSQGSVASEASAGHGEDSSGNEASAGHLEGFVGNEASAGHLEDSVGNEASAGRDEGSAGDSGANSGSTGDSGKSSNNDDGYFARGS